MDKIKEAIGHLNQYQLNEYYMALEEGYKDEICPKCSQIFLAHHHFVRCDLVNKSHCPMIGENKKSLLERILGE